MKSNTAYRTKLRAVFLAAIMVISVVGMSVAFTGAAAASVNTGEVDYSPSNPWQGQDVTATVSDTDTASGANPNIGPGDTIDLRVVDSFDESDIIEDSFVEEYNVEEEGGELVVKIDTDDLESARYFLEDQNGDINRVRSNTFEVRVQSLTAEFDEDDLPAIVDDFEDSQVELDVSSGRSNYAVNVSANGDLDNEELFNIFIASTLNGLPISDVSQFEGSPSNVIWVVGDDGELEAIDDNGDGDVVTIDSRAPGVLNEGDEVSFDSPADAFKTLADADFGESGSLGAYDFEPFDQFTNLNDITYEQNEDEPRDIDSLGTGVQLGDWNVGIFATGEDDDTADFDEKIVISTGGQGDVEENVAFAGIDEGDYEFTFEVTDTAASATASTGLREVDVDGSFSAGTYQATAGDLAHFEFELEDAEEAWIQIGDEDSDFVDVIYVEVDEADEPVEITINTRLLGNPSNSNLLDDPEDVYDVENTEVFESAFHGGLTVGDTGNVFGDDDTSFGTGDSAYEAYLDELGLIDTDDNENKFNMLTRPLQPTDYELQLAGDDVDDIIFDSDAGAGEADDQLDTAVLELTVPTIGDIVTHVAPEENADDEDDIAELLEIVTQRDEVATDDRLIVQVEATGLYGGLIAGPEDRDSLDVDFDRLEDGVSTDTMDNFFDVEEINFEIEADARTGNQDPLKVSFDGDDDDTYLLIGPDQEQFFLIVDTSSDSAFDNGNAPEDGVSFTVTFEFDADNEDDRFEFDDEPFKPEGDAENYPYLLQGNVLSSSTEFDIEPRTVTFENLNADDEVQAENIENSEISGTTNIAPGSSAELRVASTDASTSFRIGQSVDINENGEFTAEFDFSGQEPGDEFDTRFRAEGSGVDTVDSVIVAEGDLGVEEPVEDDGVDDEDDVVDDGDDVVDDDDEVVDDDDDVEDTDDETPGFGALVALVALIGAALLATRRQN